MLLRFRFFRIFFLRETPSSACISTRLNPIIDNSVTEETPRQTMGLSQSRLSFFSYLFVGEEERASARCQMGFPPRYRHSPRLWQGCHDLRPPASWRTISQLTLRAPGGCETHTAKANGLPFRAYKEAGSCYQPPSRDASGRGSIRLVP